MEEEMDLRQLFKIFVERKLLILAITVLSLVLGVVYSKFLKTPIFESSTTLVLSKQESTSDNVTSQSEAITQNDILLNQKLVNTYSEIIKSRKVLKQVIENLNLDVNEIELAENISVVSVKDTEIMKVTVEDYDPDTAAKIANEIPSVFAIEVLDIYNIKNVHIIDTAEIAEEPSNINHIRDIGIFFVSGFILSSLLVLFIFYFDNTIKSAEDVESYLELDTLTSIPVDKDNKGKPSKRKRKRKLPSKAAL